PEVVGLLGYSRGLGVTVTSMDQIKELPGDEKAVVVDQTTQNTALYEEIKEWCGKNRPHYKLFDTICGSTEKRQSEIRELAQTHDNVIVVGGKQSGNTKRLAQVARETGTPAVHIETISEIDFSTLDTSKSIAITAGASTPNWIITDTCAQVARNSQKNHPVAESLIRCLEILLHTNVFLALGAGALTFACSKFQGVEKIFPHAWVAMLYVFSMQVFNNLLTIKSDTYNHPARAAFHVKYRGLLAGTALAAGLGGLYLASRIGGWLFFGVLLIMSLSGVSFSLNIIPQCFSKGKFRAIKDIPGSKTLFTAMAWGIVTVIFPVVGNSFNFIPLVAAFCFSCGLIFSRTTLLDVQAIQGDRIAGKETLPILLGVEKSVSLVKRVLLGSLVILLLGALAGVVPRSYALLALAPLGLFLVMVLYRREKLVPGLKFEFLVESSLILTGIIALWM
ncbi:MAG: UbiA family prenyltransferase, partial [Desulfovibrionales bacterium]|nr:UbiA family prenyltransferase [Desulfovibrionales bacterium]